MKEEEVKHCPLNIVKEFEHLGQLVQGHEDLGINTMNDLATGTQHWK
jgi:hypothetical protein